MDGVDDSLNTLLPTCTCYRSKFGHLVKPYERKFGDPLRSRQSKSLKVKVIEIDTGRSPTYYREEIRGLTSCKCARKSRKCMTSYARYPIFPGVTSTEHPTAPTRNTGGSSPRPGRRSSARHPNVEHKPAPMRSTIGASFHRRRPSIFGCWPSALEHFPIRGDVGAIHGNLLRRKRLKTYLLTQSHSGNVLSCVLLLYCFIHCITVVHAVSCSGHFLKFCSID